MTASAATLRQRSAFMQALRLFFWEQGFLEIETPVRVPTPALEDYIDAIPAGTQWLRTSPELHMKRLLGHCDQPLFQIGPCFRLGERGPRHREEFAMLEWYEPQADYRQVMARTSALLRHLSAALDLRRDYFHASHQELSVRQAFSRWAGLSPEEAVSRGVYEQTLCLQVEPQLGLQAPLFLMDYPASQAALARLKPEDPSLAERFELYIDGVEIANAYSELVDGAEQRRRFEATQELRRREKRAVYEMDEDFLQALEKGLLPPTGGIAIGLDRLFMVMLGHSTFEDVLAF